ncbi:MAG: hypothetical protein R3B45_10715 [Bdellovibrionota bacterium]
MNEIIEVNETLIKMVNGKPKYSIFENERKWLVDEEFIKNFKGGWNYLITDKYIKDSRLRVRSALDSETDKFIYKFCKKYGSESPYSEPISSIYLSTLEYQLLSQLPGNIIIKRRYIVRENDFNYNLDIFEGHLQGLVLAEIEADSSDILTSIPSPSFATKEVTEDVKYSGGYLAFNGLKNGIN